MVRSGYSWHNPGRLQELSETVDVEVGDSDCTGFTVHKVPHGGLGATEGGVCYGTAVLTSRFPYEGTIHHPDGRQ